jgi:hypothetical protein
MRTCGAKLAVLGRLSQRMDQLLDSLLRTQRDCHVDLKHVVKQPSICGRCACGQAGTVVRIPRSLPAVEADADPVG